MIFINHECVAFEVNLARLVRCVYQGLRFMYFRFSYGSVQISVLFLWTRIILGIRNMRDYCVNEEYEDHMLAHRMKISTRWVDISLCGHYFSIVMNAGFLITSAVEDSELIVEFFVKDQDWDPETVRRFLQSCYICSMKCKWHVRIFLVNLCSFPLFSQKI